METNQIDHLYISIPYRSNFRNFLASHQFMSTNIKHRKTKSQETVIESIIVQKRYVKIIISQDEHIQIQVPSDCPLQILTSLLVRKVGEYKKNEVIGFESVPQDYNFDYRLSKSIGTLSKNMKLNCLFKKNIIQSQDLNYQGQTDLDLSSQYRINKYKICRCLSSGGFSKVFLVRNLINGQFYAAKFMDKQLQVNVNRSEAIKNQFIVHKQLSHPYIVKMEEYIQTKRFYILIMEYCPGGQLFTLLKHNRYMQEEQAKVLFLQTLFAIKYLHQKKIVFRDIKPENILIDQLGNIKVADFGLAKFIRGKTNSYCGSVQYMAPEIVSRKKYSFEVDLYCMGALLYQILIGCPPFYNPKFTNQQTKYHIIHSQACFPNRVPLSDEVKDLISSLLNKRSEQRLGYFRGVAQILEHPWVGNIDFHQYLTKKIQCPFKPNLAKEHFQKQKGNQGKLFLQKIEQDIKKCKRQTLPNRIQIKLAYSLNPQSKFKSKSLESTKFCSSKGNLKRMFAEVTNENHQHKIFNIKSKNSQQFMTQNLKKKYSNHSRSLSKFSVKGRSKSKQMSQALLINHKSCNSSKRNSVYKKFLEASHKKTSNRINNLSMIYQAKDVASHSKSKSQKRQNLQRNFQFSNQNNLARNLRNSLNYQQKQNQNHKLKKTKKKTGFNYFPKNVQAARSIRQTFI